MTSDPILEQLTAGRLLCREDGHIQWADLPCEKIFGYERGELAGKPINDLIPSEYKAIHPLHMAKFFTSKMTYRMRAMNYGWPLSGLRKDGRVISLSIFVTNESVDGMRMAEAFIQEVKS